VDVRVIEEPRCEMRDGQHPIDRVGIGRGGGSEGEGDGGCVTVDCCGCERVQCGHHPTPGLESPGRHLRVGGVLSDGGEGGCGLDGKVQEEGVGGREEVP